MKTELSFVIGLILALLLLSAPTFADESKLAAPQWKQCWHFSDSGLGLVHPIAKNERLFLPLANGSLLAINSLNGETLWRAELGGEIIGRTAVNGFSVFVTSQIAAAGEKQSVIVIRALSLATGLTTWQGELPQASRVSLVLHEESLLVSVSGEDAGSNKIIALSSKNGELLWSQNLTAEIATNLIVAGEIVYFGTADNVFHALKIANSVEIKHFSLPHPTKGLITIANGILLFGDAAGRVSALRETDGKVLWTLRLGGAAQDILSTGNGVLISSLDNFVYFHHRTNGKRLWRRRLSSRPIGANLLDDQNAILTVSGENNASLINLKKGKIVGQLLLDTKDFVVAAPFLAENRIFIPTLQGLYTFAPANAVCSAK